MLNVAQLETDLRAAKDRAKTLIDNTARACQAHVATPATATAPAVMGRLMTDEEKGAIKAALDDADAIARKIDGAASDTALLRRFEAIRGGDAAAAGAPDLPTVTRAAQHSIGHQFATHVEILNFIKQGGHRRNGAWSSPAIECVNPLTMRATTLTEDPASGGKLVVPQYLPGIRSVLFRRLVVADLMASGQATSNAIIYMVETLFTNAAAPVAEGGAKPESALTFDQRTDPVSKIAHWLPVTEELLEDVPAMQAYIDARLELGVQLAEEDQLLNGNGTPPNLMGIMNRVGLAAPVARNAGATPPETNADAVLRQITAIATTAFVYPDGVVMNPTNWFTTVTSKDGNGQYFGGGPFSSLPTATLWGTPVAITPSIVAGTALVGAYGTMSQVFRKGGIRIEASNSHQDYFVKNLVAIRAEERLALAVYRPGAFGKVTGLN
jgi:HK97 family phage major capsid protein